MAKTKDYYKGLTIEFDANATKVSAVLGDLYKEFQQSQSAARRLDAALKLDPKSIGLIKDRITETTNQLKVTQERVNVLNQALGEAKDPEVINRLNQQLHIAEARMETLKAKLVELNVADAKTSGFGKLASDLQDAGSAIEGIGQAASSAGDKMTMGLTAPIAAFTVATLGAATTIDSALTDVRKTVDGTEQEYQGLKEAAIEYSKTNAVTAEDVLQVQALGAQLGYAKDELEMIGRVGSGLDIATDMNAEKATTDLAQFANITGMAHDKTENWASTVVALGNTTATTESNISDMSQSVAAAGSQIGLTEAEILGLSAALASMGLEARGGGSNVSKIMSQIDKDVATSSEGVQAWAAAAGMSADEFAAKWQSRPIEALEALFAGMDAATKSGSNLSVIIESLGIESSQAVDVTKRLANGHELLATAVDTATQAWELNTALATEVANKNDSLEAKMQMLQNRVTAMLEKVGKPVADALLSIVDAAEPLFEAIESGAQAFADMDEGSQRLIVSAVGIVAALGPVLSIGGRITETFGGVVGTLGTAGESFITFAKSMSQTHDVMASLAKASEGLGGALSTGLVGIGVAAAIAAIGVLITSIAENIEYENDMAEATDRLVASVSNIDSAIASASESASGMADTLSMTKDEIERTTEAALEAQQKMAEGITSAFDEVGKNSGMVELYANQMAELSSKSELTKGEQEKLKAAVEGFNSIASTSIGIIDGQTGALSTSIDVIHRAADAYKEYARAQAIMSAYGDLQKELVENSIEQAKYEEVLKDRVESRGFAQDIANGVTLEQMNAWAAAARGLDEAKEREEALTQSIAVVEGMMSSATSTTSEYESTLQQLGVASGTTSEKIESDAEQAAGAVQQSATEATKAIQTANTEAIEAQRKANDQAYREQQRAYQAEAKALEKALDAEYRAQQKAYQAEADALSKALDAEYRARSKEFEREYSLLSKELDRQYQELSKSLAAELSAIREANDQAYQARKSALDAEEAQLSKSLSKQYDALRSSLSKELSARKKANQQAVSDARKANDAEVKAYQAATKERIAAIESEYQAKLKLLDADPRSSAIDSRIKELEAEGKADDKAAKERERAEKESELRREVERAKSRRKRAEAEKALNDYLLQVEEERRDEARQAEIESLREEQSLIKEDNAAKKEALKEEYDNRKSTIEESRAAELEQIREANDAEIEALREKHDAEEEAISEANAARLESAKEHNDAIIAQMAEAHESELQQLRDNLDAQAEAVAEANSARLEAEKEANSERLSQVKEAQSEELQSLKDAHSEQLATLRESQSEQLRELKDAQSEQVSALRESQSDALQALRDSQSEQVKAMQDGGTAMVAEAESTGDAIEQAAEDTTAKVEDDERKMHIAMLKQAKDTKSDLTAEANATKRDTTGIFEKMASTVEGRFEEFKNRVAKTAKEQTSEVKSATAPVESGLKTPYEKGTSSLVSALTNSLSSATRAAKDIATNTTSAVDGVPGKYRSVGDSSPRELANGMYANAGLVHKEAQRLAEYQDAANKSGSSRVWGADLAINIGNGMYEYAYHVGDAAAYIAQVIANNLAHTVPKEGVLREGGRGEVVWGEHIAQNIIRGMVGSEDAIRTEAERYADMLADALSPDAITEGIDRAYEHILNRTEQMANRYRETVSQITDLATRLDERLNYAGSQYATAGAGTTNVRQEISVSVNLSGFSVSNAYDIRDVSRAIASQTAAELAAKLG